MKIALLVLVGLVVGALGGAALGIGACLAWLQIFRTSGFEDNNAGPGRAEPVGLARARVAGADARPAAQLR